MAFLEKRPMSFRHWQVLSILIVAEIISAFEYSMIMAGLPAWLRIYGDPIGIGWLVSAYFLISGSSAALSARFGDIVGRKKVLLVLIACCCIGSVISAVGPTLTWVIIGRAVQGLAGGIVALCYGLAREHLPPEKVSVAVGAIVATATGAAAIGLLLGGVLTDLFGPQSIFVASAILAAIAFVLIALFLPPSTPRGLSGKIDILGGVLMIPAIALLLLAMSNLARWPIIQTLGIAALGIAIFIFWVRYELRHPDPLIDLRLIGEKRIALANMIIGFSSAGQNQLTTLTSLLVQQPIWTAVGLGTSATLVGFLKFPGLFVGIVGSLWAGALAGRRGGHYPVLIGCALTTATMIVGTFVHDRIAIIVIILTLANLGGIIGFAGVSNIVVAAAPTDRTSEAAGLNVVVRALSQAFGAQIVVILLATSKVTNAAGQSFPDADAYRWAFAFILGCSALMLAGAFWLFRVSNRLAAKPTP